MPVSPAIRQQKGRMLSLYASASPALWISPNAGRNMPHCASPPDDGRAHPARDGTVPCEKCWLLLDSSQSLLETIQPSACIDKLLLAGVEGVALGANVHTQFTALGGAGDKGLSAGAADCTLNVLRMNSVLHFTIPHFEIPDVL